MKRRVVAFSKWERPRGLGPGDLFSGVLGGPHVGHAHVTFFGHHKVGSSLCADRAVAGRVAEESASDAGEGSGGGVDRVDGLDPIFFGVGPEGEVIEVEIDIVFRSHDFLFEVIDKLADESGRVAGEVGELVHDFAKVGEFAELGSAHGPNLNFGGSVAAEDRAVVNESNFQSVARRRDGRTESGVASAYNDEIIAVLCRWGGRELEGFAAELEKRLAFARRNLFGILGEVERVAATVEAGQIMKLESGLCRGDFDGASALPVPVRPFGSESGGGWFAINADLKFSRRAWCLPLGDPVLGADMKVVSSDGGEGDFGGRVSYRSSETVCHEIRGSHVEDELGIDGPASAISKSLCLHEEVVRGVEGSREKCDQDWSRHFESDYGMSLVIFATK